MLICLGDTPVIRTSAAFSGSVGSAAARGRGGAVKLESRATVTETGGRVEEEWRGGVEGEKGGLTWVFEVLEQPVLEDADGLLGQVPLPAPTPARRGQGSRSQYASTRGRRMDSEELAVASKKGGRTSGRTGWRPDPSRP